MSKRRSHGDGSLFWDASKNRWVGVVSVGFDGRGKRIRRKVSGRTKTETKQRLRDLQREVEKGLPAGDRSLTVEDAVEDWLHRGLGGVSQATSDNYATLARKHIVPHLGSLKLKDLRARHVEDWLDDLRPVMSTRTLRLVHGLLNRAAKRALARDLIARNVVELATIPEGRPGRPSKSLTVIQAEAVLEAARNSPLHAYIVVSLLTGARTEEMRPLTWSNTFLEPDTSVDPPLPPRLNVFRSVRRSGDTKTRRSRRSLALPERCVDVLAEHRFVQDRQRARAGNKWQENDLVFASALGSELDAANVRRSFRYAMSNVVGINPADWTPRELRHSFVSLLSDQGVPIEEISRLVGHSSTTVTETVYRHQLRPVIETGAEAMDGLFGR